MTWSANPPPVHLTLASLARRVSRMTAELVVMSASVLMVTQELTAKRTRMSVLTVCSASVYFTKFSFTKISEQEVQNSNKKLFNY